MPSVPTTSRIGRRFGLEIGRGGARKWFWPSRRVWTGAAVGSAVGAAVVAGFARPVLFDLVPESEARSVRRFDAGARDVEVDARPFWARIPRILPGPAETWAGSTSHALHLTLGIRAARPLDLYLYVAEGWDGTVGSRLTVAVNDSPITTIQVSPGGSARHKLRIPARTVGGGAPVRLSIVNEAGPAVAWRRIRLVEADPRFAWRHLGRRGRFPPESAAFLAVSLGALSGWALGPAAKPGLRRVMGAIGPAAGLALLTAALALPPERFLAPGVPRWAWLLVPWVLLPLRPRARTTLSEPHPASVPVGRRLGTIAVNGLLALGAVVVSLALAELALRSVFRDVTSAGDTRSYFHRTYTQEPTHEANSFGFREREFRLKKPSGTYRLAVIGDSFAYGAGLATPERFSNLLERRLNESGQRGLAYEVLNFGRGGADTDHEVRTLRTFVLGTGPDFVLLQWYVNDFENGGHSGRPTPLMMVPFPHLHVTLLRSSALYSLLDPQWARLQAALGLVESHAAYMVRRFGDPEGPDSVYAMERLKEFIDECRRHGTPMGIVLFPRVGPDLAAGTYEYAYLHDRVLEACRDEEVTCVDLRERFAGYTDYKQLWVTPLDGHPSALANRLAMERLLDAFGERWLAARPGG